MKGVGGPLLCIGDLLRDLEETEADGAVFPPDHRITPDEPALPPASSSPILPNPDNTLHSSDLTKLFQEHYDRLDEALTGKDHSWTALTLKLCTALETANKLLLSTNSNASLLSEKVVELQKIIRSGDSAVAAAKAIHACLRLKAETSLGSQYDH